MNIISYTDKRAKTPLHIAANEGHLEIAKLLVKKRADVNIKDNGGQTSIH